MSEHGEFQAVPACAGAPRVGAPPAQYVMELGWSWWASAVVRTAAELKLADAIDLTPVTSRELAERAGADPGALVRLMRALVGYGIFRLAGPDQYAHTAASRALRSDDPSRIAEIMLTGSHWSWSMWDRLSHTIRTGEPGFQAAFGKDLVSYFLADDPVAGEQCHRGYSAQAEALNGQLVNALDLGGIRCVVDVGGGRGSLLRAILMTHPALTGVLFELEPVLRDADPALRDGPLAERAQLMAGDCQKEITVAAELYLFRQVLHMWDDDQCVAALGGCVAAGKPGARVVLFEQLVSDPPEYPFDALMDLHMLLVTGGRERSEREYAELFDRAGLTLTAVKSTGTPLRLLEAVVSKQAS